MSGESLRTFAWLSHERPAALRRSVTSFFNGCDKEFISKSHFIVAESGKYQGRPGYIPTNSLTYIDDHFREALIRFLKAKLEMQGLDGEVIRFALDGRHIEGTEGSHRNAIALMTQGKTYLSSDDDIVFDIQKLPDSCRINTVAGEINFLPFKNFEELDAFTGKAVPFKNFLLSHENALQQATFSSPGIRGDSAYGEARFIFSLDEASLIGLCRNENFVTRSLSSRIMWRETAQSHLTPYASIATYMLGINNLQGVAPCFPFGRNLDGAFVYATKALFPLSQTAQLSFSVSHRPPVDRGLYASLSKLEFRINDLLWLMWAEWLSSLSVSLKFVDRFTASSTYFKNIGSLNHHRFKEYLKDMVCRSLFDRAHCLEEQAHRLRHEPHAPGLNSWLQVAEKEIQLCRQMALNSKLYLPIETRHHPISEYEEVELTRKWIFMYGCLLEMWPLMQGLMAKKEFKDEFIESQISY